LQAKLVEAPPIPENTDNDEPRLSLFDTLEQPSCAVGSVISQVPLNAVPVHIKFHFRWTDSPTYQELAMTAKLKWIVGELDCPFFHRVVRMGHVDL